MKKSHMHFHHWLIWGVINGVIIYLGGLLYPETIVLGNATVSAFAAVVLAALTLTLVISLLPVILIQLNVDKLTPTNKYLLYAFVNVLVVWLMSRMALMLGFGLASKFTAIYLGIVLTIVQYIYWEYLARKFA